MALQVFVNGAAHRRVFMNRKDQERIRKGLENIQKRKAYFFQGRAQVFTPVSFHQQDPAGLEINLLQQGIGEAIVRADCGFKGIDDRVAGDEYFSLGHALTQQIVPGDSRRSKMEVSQDAVQAPVDFLGEGSVLITCTQPGLHVA